MTITLPVTERGTKTTAALRANGEIPAVVYGPKQPAMDISIDGKLFTKLVHEAGESTIIELEGLKDKVEVLIKEVAFDPVKQAITHVDLYAIERGKEITTHVALEFVGEALVEKNKIGTVTETKQEVTVTCRPSVLPAEITVDVSALATEDDKILVKDLVVPDGVVVEDDPEDAVAVVSVAKEEEEAPASVDMSSIEVEQKGKDETAAAAE